MTATESHATTSGRGSSAAPKPRRRRRLSITDRIVVGLMVAVPAVLVLWLVWLPAFGSVALSFGTWNGIGGIDRIQWVGFQNYHDVATIYPPFWPAMRHNLIWLVFLFVFPTMLGILLAVVLDGNMRFGRSTHQLTRTVRLPALTHCVSFPGCSPRSRGKAPCVFGVSSRSDRLSERHRMLIRTPRRHSTSATTRQVRRTGRSGVQWRVHACGHASSARSHSNRRARK